MNRRHAPTVGKRAAQALLLLAAAVIAKNALAVGLHGTAVALIYLIRNPSTVAAFVVTFILGALAGIVALDEHTRRAGTAQQAARQEHHDRGGEHHRGVGGETGDTTFTAAAAHTTEPEPAVSAPTASTAPATARSDDDVPAVLAGVTRRPRHHLPNGAKR